MARKVARSSIFKPGELYFRGQGDGRNLCCLSANGKRLMMIAVCSGGHWGPRFGLLDCRGLIAQATDIELKEVFDQWLSFVPVHRWLVDVRDMGGVSVQEQVRLRRAAHKLGWIP